MRELAEADRSGVAVAGNYAYTLALLGHPAAVLATAGEDGADYKAWLETPANDPDQSLVFVTWLGHFNDLIKSDPAKAQNLVGQGINNATGKPLAADVIAASFKNLTFTNDPIATSLRKSAKDAEAAGLLKAVDLKGIYNLKLLNQVLTKQGEPTVKS